MILLLSLQPSRWCIMINCAKIPWSEKLESSLTSQFYHRLCRRLLTSQSIIFNVFPSRKFPNQANTVTYSWPSTLLYVSEDSPADACNQSESRRHGTCVCVFECNGIICRDVSSKFSLSCLGLKQVSGIKF